MLKWATKLRRDTKGSVLIIVGACMPLLIGSAGLAVDTIQWTLWKRQLQRAADSSSLAGVYQRVQGGDIVNVQTAINRDLSFNQNTGIALFSGYPQVSLPSDAGELKQQVQVTLGIKKKLAFSSFFIETPLITANATAASIPGGDPCVLALGTDPSRPQLTVTGNSSIDMVGCWGHSNGRSANSAAGKGSGTFTAEGISASGGIEQSRTWQVNQYTPYAPTVVDPYANVKVNQADLDSKCPSGGGSSNELNEGTNTSSLPGNVYCFSSMRVGSGQTLNLKPGTYYINGGDAFIQGNLTSTATGGVTIVLTNQNVSTTAKIGNFKVNAGSNINISAPPSGCSLGTAGCFKGIAIYQDRRASDSTVNKINGNSGSIITGAMYFPSQELEYNGTGTTSAVCTRFVAKRVTFSGNSTISNKIEKNCAAYGLDEYNVIRRVRLVA